MAVLSPPALPELPCPRRPGAAAERPRAGRGCCCASVLSAGGAAGPCAWPSAAPAPCPPLPAPSPPRADPASVPGQPLPAPELRGALGLRRTQLSLSPARPPGGGCASESCTAPLCGQSSHTPLGHPGPGAGCQCLAPGAPARPATRRLPAGARRCYGHVTQRETWRPSQHHFTLSLCLCRAKVHLLPLSPVLPSAVRWGTGEAGGAL